MSRNTTGTEPAQQPSVPRAIIHQKILDAAEGQPDASMNGIATEVSGATTDLVDQVLDMYGDPGTDQEPSETEDNELSTDQRSGDTTEGEPVEKSLDNEQAAELNEREYETLRRIHDHPEATQGELAKELGVSRATVSQRVNAIDGFDWTDRQAFVERVFDGDDGVEFGHDSPEYGSEDDAERPMATQDLRKNVERLTEQLEKLERQVDNMDVQSRSAFADPDLMHKVIHACMRSETITEDEELRILQAILGAGLDSGEAG